MVLKLRSSEPEGKREMLLGFLWGKWGGSRAAIAPAAASIRILLLLSASHT